jgi:hypothetical protein
MTDMELLRANVRDETEPYGFSDAFLQALLGRYQDVDRTSAHIWLLRAGDASLRNFKFSVDGRTVDKTMTAEECRTQAEMFRSLAFTEPAEEIVEVDWTPSFYPPEEVG